MSRKDFIGPDENTPAESMLGVNNALEELRGSQRAQDVIMLDIHTRMGKVEATTAAAVAIVHERRAPNPRWIHAAAAAVVALTVCAWIALAVTVAMASG